MTLRPARLVARVAALALALALLPAALAAAASHSEVEPNNDLWTANWLAAGGEVSGETETADDYDFFQFRVRPGQTVTTSFSHLGGAGFCDFELRTRDGFDGDLISGTVSESDDPVSEEWETDEEEILDLVLVVNGMPGCSYRFTITPAAALAANATRPARVAVPNPHDTPETAFGPLKHGVEYTGVFSDFDDVEWLFLYLPANAVSEIELVSPQPECEVSGGLYEIVDGFEMEVRQFSSDGGTASMEFYRAKGKGLVPHLIEVFGDEGCSWGVHVPSVLGAGPNPLLSLGAKLSLTLKANAQNDRKLKRRGGLRATCQVSAASRCSVTAWLPRRTAKRIGLTARKTMVKIGAGQASAERAGKVTVKVRIRRSILKKLIAAKRPVTATLEATATSPQTSSATVSRRVSLGG